MPDSAPETLARDVLADCFGRIHEQYGDLADGLSGDVATYRPDREANTIGWLLWHLARIEDDHIADAAGLDQVWTARGWQERFDLPFDPEATGYGHRADDVAAVRVSGNLLSGYHSHVHAQTMSYVDSLTVAELQRVVDERWDPPVTVGVRLVSVVGDCLEHLGQAAYVRGLADRAGLGV